VLYVKQSVSVRLEQSTASHLPSLVGLHLLLAAHNVADGATVGVVTGKSLHSFTAAQAFSAV